MWNFYFEFLEIFMDRQILQNPSTNKVFQFPCLPLECARRHLRCRFGNQLPGLIKMRIHECLDLGCCRNEWSPLQALGFRDRITVFIQDRCFELDFLARFHQDFRRNDLQPGGRSNLWMECLGLRG